MGVLLEELSLELPLTNFPAVEQVLWITRHIRSPSYVFAWEDEPFSNAG